MEATGTYQYTTIEGMRYKENEYFENGRTYEPLELYFLPEDYYNAEGYFSELYEESYYDGYGYNFYYDTYGYYEYSIHPMDPQPITWIIVLCVFGVAFFVCAILYYRYM